MKKLFIFIILLIVTSSCYVDVVNSVNDPKQETTLKLQELPKDTVTISIENSNLYVFDDSNQLKYITRSQEYTFTAILITLCIVFVFFIGMITGAHLND